MYFCKLLLKFLNDDNKFEKLFHSKKKYNIFSVNRQQIQSDVGSKNERK